MEKTIDNNTVITQQDSNGEVKTFHYLRSLVAFNFTKEKQEKFLEILKDSYYNVSLACRTVGIPRASLYKHINPKYPTYKKQFTEKMKEIHDEFMDECEALSIKQASTNPKATIERIFQLKAKRGEIYNRTNNYDPDIQKPALEQSRLESIGKYLEKKGYKVIKRESIIDVEERDETVG